MTGPYLIAVYACVSVALHELVFQRTIGDDGLTPLGAKVFAWAWPLWALCLLLMWCATLVFDFLRWWRR